MIFLHILSAELLKLRRTLAFWMIFIAPGVMLLLNFLMFHERSAYYVKQSRPLWDSLQKNSFVFWAVLMLPLFITLQTALLAALEHNEDRWRNLLAMPVPRWALYWAKLTIPCAMVFCSSAVMSFGTVLNGVLLHTLKPALQFPAPLPWGAAWHDTWLATVTALLLLTVQHWVSLRFSAFAASAGFGICATITGAILINSQKYGPWWPWCLPAQIMSAKPEAVTHAIWYSAAGALIAAVLGTVEFTRREIRA